MQRGIATLELLIALGILTLILSGIVIISFGNQVIALDTNVHTDALYLTQNELQKAAADVEDGDIPTTTTAGIFTLTPTITPSTECVTDVNITNTWWEDTLRPQSLALNTLVTDTYYFDALEEDCDTEVLHEEKWKTPEVVGSLALVGGLKDMDVVRRGNELYAFVVSQNTSTTTPDMIVIDVTNPSTPNIVASFDMDPFIFPMTAIDVAGDYAYIGSSMENAQLIVIDVSTPSAPGCIVTGGLPGVGGSYPGAISVSYYDGYAYVGTRETLGNELHIFNVDTPFLCDDGVVHEGSVEIGHTINDIAVRDNTAYLATSGDRCELLLMDVRDPGALINNCPWGGGGGADTFDAPGDSNGTSLMAGFGKLILGRTRADSNGDFHILDIHDTDNISSLGQGELHLSASSDFISAVAQRGDVLVAAVDGGEGIQIWNIADPKDPQFLSSVGEGHNIIALEVFENTIYALQESPPALLVITQ